MKVINCRRLCYQMNLKIIKYHLTVIILHILITSFVQIHSWRLDIQLYFYGILRHAVLRWHFTTSRSSSTLSSVYLIALPHFPVSHFYFHRISPREKERRVLSTVLSALTTSLLSFSKGNFLLSCFKHV